MYSKEDIINKLKSYNKLCRAGEQLRFEIDNFRPIVSDNEMIESLCFSSEDGERVATGRISDKTQSIALSYMDKTVTANVRHREELLRELEKVEMGVMRLDFYLTLLPEQVSSILKMQYFEGLPWDKITERLSISRATLKRLREEGISELVEYYNRIAGTS